MNLLKYIILLMFLSNTAFAETVHIVLDPAHGGPSEWGITGEGFDEKTINLILAKKIQTLIDTDDSYEVVLTRSSDYPLSLNERRKIANQYSPSIFLSIHSSTYDKEPAFVTYVLKQAQWKQNSIFTPIEFVHVNEYNHSMKLAETFENEFPEHIEHQITVSKFPLASIVGIITPAVMIECQCVSRSQPSADDASIDTMARAIADGVQTFARKVY